VQFADLISMLSKGIIKPKDQIKEDIESSLSDDDPSNQYGGDQQVDDVQHQFDGAIINRSLIKHANKLYDYHYSFIQDHIDKQEFHKSDETYLTLNEISNFVILIGLLTEFGFRNYDVEVTEVGINYDDHWRKELAKLEKNYQLIKLKKVDRDDLNVSFYQVKTDWRHELIEKLDEIHESLFIPSEELGAITLSRNYFSQANLDKQKEDSLKSILVDSLGVFLLHVATTKGFKKYEFDSLNNKLSEFRENLFKLSVSLILNMDWATKELDQRNILLLDLLHLICPNAVDVDALASSIEHSTKLKSRYFKNNLNEFLTSILKPYCKWKEDFSSDKTKLSHPLAKTRNHSIIFKSSLGFAYYRKAKSDTIRIKKPGLWQYSEDDEYFEIKYPGIKVISLTT
jgi:hypothetical protein